MVEWKKYRYHILAFFLIIGVSFGSMYIWALTIIMPIFAFLVLKLFKIWRTKERLLVGIPAMAIGIILFFGFLSYQVSDLSTYQIENTEHTLKAQISPYTTSDLTKNFTVTATYKKAVNNTLKYEVTSQNPYKMVESGEVSGIIVDNTTRYNFTLSLPKGIYNINLTVENATVFIGAIKATPADLFGMYMRSAAPMLIGLLSALYILFIYGVYMIRRGRKMREKMYEKKKS